MEMILTFTLITHFCSELTFLYYAVRLATREKIIERYETGHARTERLKRSELGMS